MTTNTIYSRRFGPENRYWSADPAMNRMFLQAHQNWMNDKLRTRGFLFLNEIQEALGFDWTSAGQLVGWVRNPDDPKNYGIDFNITPVEEEPGSFTLDFNVHGVIYDKIEDL